MGIGTNSLGYGHKDVDNAVRQAITKGNMSTLNCPEEVYLAEKLLEINPWAESVKFARTGGEANSIAIRIARASSGKDNIAICGYHGWHDWYLSVNHDSKDGLNNHLLPGLEPLGVPKSLKKTVFPFNYNNFEELENLCNSHDIGVIKMEVMRNNEPKNDFLKKVRNLATKRGIILIFDECSSGFRETFGGIHKKYFVNPDMAMFGKTIGNGYALTAVVGKKEIMESAEKTFISSTFWTERIGPTAAKISKSNGIDIKIEGIPAMSSYSFMENNLTLQTYVTQEMLKKGFLASDRFYACISHDDNSIKIYLEALNEIFIKISKSILEGVELDTLLDGPIKHSGFKRLN